MRTLPSSTLTLLDRLEASEAVRPIDLALGRLLAGMDVEDGDHDAGRTDAVALAAVLTSARWNDGDSLVLLGQHAGGPFPGEVDDPLPTLPSLGVWTDRLRRSTVVGRPGEARPLLLEGDRLALKRFWEAEERLAHAVAARLHEERDLAPPSDRLCETFETLFPKAGGEKLDGQAAAAAVALRQPFMLVGGGPGTGKTYTATRILALLLADDPDRRIALAAPTGKAAQRLTESLSRGCEEIAEAHPALADLVAHMPTEAQTLHKLLGANPARGGFRHDAKRPLPFDTVLVDEASMIALPLFDALVAALPPHARLLLLGDPDQLASVEAGAVFADLCRLGEGHAPAPLAAFCKDLGLRGLPSQDDASPLAGAVVRLTESRRFDPHSGLGRLAEALRVQDEDTVRDALLHPDGEDVRLVSERPVEAAVDAAFEHAQRVVSATSPEGALAVLAEQQLLAVVRRGTHGVEGINEAVEARLMDSRTVRWSLWNERFYRGRPLLITQNDPVTGLRNGDVGVCWTGQQGSRYVAFPDKEGGLREIALHRLPAREPAWALTIHKSQGSEFGAVGVVLPPPEEERAAAMVTRELLYTAITRARERVTLYGDAGLAARAAVHRQERRSGLAERLARAFDLPADVLQAHDPEPEGKSTDPSPAASGRQERLPF